MSAVEDLAGGEIDTTYQTVQRDMFTSGLAAQIGANAFGVWSAIKAHADFQDGRAWPSIRKLAEMTGTGQTTVVRAIEALEEAHLLRKVAKGWPTTPGKTKGRTHTYVARERMDVRLGGRVLCTIVVDYVPLQMRQRLAAVREALRDPAKSSDELWAQVDIIPGPGFVWDPERKLLRAQIPAREVPLQTPARAPLAPSEARAKVKALADQMRVNQAPGVRAKRMPAK